MHVQPQNGVTLISQPKCRVNDRSSAFHEIMPSSALNKLGKLATILHFKKVKKGIHEHNIKAEPHSKILQTIFSPLKAISNGTAAYVIE